MGSAANMHGGGTSGTPEDSVLRFSNTFARSRKTSVCLPSLKLLIPKSTVHGVLQKHLKALSIQIALLHEVKLDDAPKRERVAEDILQPFAIDNTFWTRLRFLRGKYFTPV